MFQLNELEQDALVEIFNIGVGKAAAALSKMTSEKVLLSVPTIHFMECEEASQQFPEDSKAICGISQHFVGPFTTEAVLMFPEEKTLEIMQRVLGVDYPIEQLTEMEQEGLCEIGNIVLNACMASIAEIFHGEFHATLPVLRMGTGKKVLGIDAPSEGRMVMLVWVNLLLEERQIEGCLAFLSVLPDIQRFTDTIDRFIKDLST